MHDKLNGLSLESILRPFASFRGGRPLVYLGVLVLAPMLLSACKESPLPPTAPSSLPADRVSVLSLACPANISGQSLDGRPLEIAFTTPSAQGGLEPVVTECTPASGDAFPVGISTVTCTAEDGLQQAASCALSVTIIPTLDLERILAFGDSVTAGVTASPIRSIATLEPSESYPTKLSGMLRERYTRQTVRVANAGLPGELAAEALSRFRSEMTSEQPDLVLLMEGTNDLDAEGTAGGDTAARVVEDMVVYAKGRGAEVFLATIPPQRGVLATSAQVAPYNDLIRSVAQRQGVPLIDIHRIIETGQCAGVGNSSLSLSCLGDDHLHPTRAGNDLIAMEFFDEIVEMFEPGAVGAAGAGASGISLDFGVPGRGGLRSIGGGVVPRRGR